MNKNLSRRNFLQLMGAATAFAALPGIAKAGASLKGVQLLKQDVVAISFAGWGGTAEQDGVAAAIEVFQQENPGITVEFRHTPDTDFTTVFLSNIAAGTPPDTS